MYQLVQNVHPQRVLEMTKRNLVKPSAMGKETVAHLSKTMISYIRCWFRH